MQLNEQPFSGIEQQKTIDSKAKESLTWLDLTQLNNRLDFQLVISKQIQMQESNKFLNKTPISVWAHI